MNQVVSSNGSRPATNISSGADAISPAAEAKMQTEAGCASKDDHAPPQSVVMQIVPASADNRSLYPDAKCVLMGLSVSLSLFAFVQVYSMAIAVYNLARNHVEASDALAEIWPGSHSSLMLTISMANAASIVFQAIVGLLSIIASRHIRAAGKASASEDDLMPSSELEKAVLYISAIFNSAAVAMVMKALWDIVSAVAIYRDAIVIMSAAATLCIALFWLSGFGVLLIWRGRAAQRPGSRILVDVLSGSLDEVDEVPVFIRFWLNQVFGRTAIQRKGIAPKSLGKRAFGVDTDVDLGHFADIDFDEGQLHILHLLPEAMRHAGIWFAYRFGSSTLLLVSFVFLQLWRTAAQQALEALQLLLGSALILAGALVFTHALRDSQSDMQSLMKGFVSLTKTFRRLSMMIITTTTLQLILRFV